MAALVKLEGPETVIPGTPPRPAIPAFARRVYAPPSPAGWAYNAFTGTTPAEFEAWSAMFTTFPGDNAYYGPSADMEYGRPDGGLALASITGYPADTHPPGMVFRYTWDVPSDIGWTSAVARQFVKTSVPNGRLVKTIFMPGINGHGPVSPYAYERSDGLQLLSAFPGAPAIPGTPTVVIHDYREGWNAGANSVEVLDGDVRVTFEVVLVAAIVVGFARIRPDVTDRASITHAFSLDLDPEDGTPRYAIMESGLLRTGHAPFTPGAVFRIERETLEGLVAYKINDVVVHRSDTPVFGPLFVGSALYRAGDTVL